MRHAVDLLSQYAQYHRDRRNIISHFVGVPMIVFAVGVLLARPAFSLGGWALSPACRPTISVRTSTRSRRIGSRACALTIRIGRKFASAFAFGSNVV